MSTVIMVSWTANPSSEGVTSYDVFESKNGAGMTLKETVTSPTITFTDLPPGAYIWSVSATNFVGSSARSQPVSGPVIPSVPLTPKVTVVVS